MLNQAPPQGGGGVIHTNLTHPRSHFVFVCDIYGDHLHILQRLLIQLMNLEQKRKDGSTHEPEAGV